MNVRRDEFKYRAFCDLTTGNVAGKRPYGFNHFSSCPTKKPPLPQEIGMVDVHPCLWVVFQYLSIPLLFFLSRFFAIRQDLLFYNRKRGCIFRGFNQVTRMKVDYVALGRRRERGQHVIRCEKWENHLAIFLIFFVQSYRSFWREQKPLMSVGLPLETGFRVDVDPKPFCARYVRREGQRRVDCWEFRCLPWPLSIIASQFKKKLCSVMFAFHPVHNRNMHGRFPGPRL